MPDETPDTTAPAAGPATPAPYEFPFPVPADFAAATDEELRTALAAVREHAGTFTGLEPAQLTQATITALQACRDLAVNLNQELTGRTARADAAAGFAAEIAAAADVPAPPPAAPPAPPAAGGEPLTGEVQNADGTAVTAGARPQPPTVSQVAGRNGGAPAQLPEETERPRYATMTASADVPGFPAGAPLEAFDHAARALANRMGQYPTMTAGKARAVPGKRPITVYDPTDPGRRLVMTNYARHGGVVFTREFPDDLRVPEGASNGYEIAEHAANQRRLPGGSLVASALDQVRRGRSLTAAAGWCAPSEVLYELCELETLDGILDIPEIQTARGGWQIPIDGGPDFSAIWNAIGNAGDTHLTEAEVIADTAKVCTDIPCPPFEDVRLGVDYVCLTGGLLQRRGYPEVVARWSRGAMTALAHKINFGVIQAIVAATGASNIIPADPSGDDAISGLLAAVDLAIIDMKYRARMGFTSTMEVILPMWVLAQLRASATRRRGVDMVSLADQRIIEWFTQRDAVPRFVYDWQDGYSGLAGGPGGATPLTALPSTVDFVVYPAGTFVKPVQDVVQLDTIYDSTKLATNEYTAIFAEDGWAVMQMCPLARRYTARVDPSGVVGCCPGAEVS